MAEILEQFKEYQKKIQQYNQILSLLHWDLTTMAPEKGVESKLDLIRFFSTEVFRLSTAREYGDMLEALARPEEFEHLDDAMQLTVKRGLLEYQRFLRVPEEFYTEYVTEKARSEKAWEKAKRSSDFSLYAPHLEKIITMTKQYARYMEPDQDPYEVLLDLYEEGIDSRTIDRVFAEIREGLRPLLGKIAASPRPDLSAIEGCYDIDAQKKVQELLLSYIGFDFTAGAAAESEHPFTMDICPGDIRVTNHFREDNPIDAMFSAIHEGGHAIFGQSIDPIYADTAVWQVNMMGLHESQSRFYENILGRNKNFWIPVYPKIQKLLPAFQDITLEDFYQEINHVQNSFIRTDADEVTYCLHIILRYEIEKAIFRDHVPVSGLPALWNQKMQEYLHITPSNDAEGILQDMHWSAGDFGYFPSYLLGSIYDGMFLNALEEELGSVDKLLANGEILSITRWLKENIHQYGSLRLPKEVIASVCHKELSAKPLLDYFRKKYTEVYHL